MCKNMKISVHGHVYIWYICIEMCTRMYTDRIMSISVCISISEQAFKVFNNVLSHGYSSRCWGSLLSRQCLCSSLIRSSRLNLSGSSPFDSICNKLQVKAGCKTNSDRTSRRVLPRIYPWQLPVSERRSGLRAGAGSSEKRDARRRTKEHLLGANVSKAWPCRDHFSQFEETAAIIFNGFCLWVRVHHTMRMRLEEVRKIWY